MELTEAIAVFDKSAKHTRPNSQTEAWKVIRAALTPPPDATVVGAQGDGTRTIVSCQCHTDEQRRLCLYKSGCVLIETHATPAAGKGVDDDLSKWLSEQVCVARNEWARKHERDWLEDHGEQVHPDDFIGRWIAERLPAPSTAQARYHYALTLIDAAANDGDGMAGVAFSSQVPVDMLDGKSPSQIADMLCRDAHPEAALTRQPVAGDGMVLVPRDVDPLDAPYNCDAVIKLLANPPSAKPFNDELAYYQHWWSQLIEAAAPAATPTDGGEG